jgi:translation initiation factor eIF-2B subunit delta
VDRVETAKFEAAENAVSVLGQADYLLLHDYSSTVLAAIENMPKDTEKVVYVTEARPRFLGRKTARELADIPNILPRLIVDNAAGFVMDKIDRVVVGMDCIVDSTLYNRVGTYPLAVVAHREGVPMTVLGSSAKLVEGEFKFENEFRAVSEVIREPPVGFSVCNPAYDATPTELLDSVITEKGIDYHLQTGE